MAWAGRRAAGVDTSGPASEGAAAGPRGLPAIAGRRAAAAAGLPVEAEPQLAQTWAVHGEQRRLQPGQKGETPWQTRGNQTDFAALRGIIAAIKTHNGYF